MPRTSRKLKGRPAQVEPARAVSPRTGQPAGELRQAFCPVCFVTHGMKKQSYEDGEVENFWGRRDNYPELGSAPFGVVQEVGRGRGHSFSFLRHFTPDDDPDGFFPLVKARLLKALQSWLFQGWVSKDEIREILD